MYVNIYALNAAEFDVLQAVSPRRISHQFQQVFQGDEVVTLTVINYIIHSLKLVSLLTVDGCGQISR